MSPARMTSTSGGSSSSGSPSDERDMDLVQRGIERDGVRRPRVDVRAQYLGRAGMERRDGAQPGAGREVEHPRAAHLFGMVEDVPRDGLAACPRECPVGRRQLRIGSVAGERLPQGHELIGEMQPHLRHERRRVRRASSGG